MGKPGFDQTNKELGIGVDIIDCARFEGKTPAKDKRFFKRIFSESELEYCFSKKNSAQYLAARFAGKEAVFKALNDSEVIKKKFEILPENIEISNQESGGPQAKLIGLPAGKDIFNKLIINLSLSHCEGKAIAFAVVRTKI